MPYNTAYASPASKHRSRVPPPNKRVPTVPTTFSYRSLDQLRKIVDDPLTHPHFAEDFADRRDAADIAFFAHNASLDDGPKEADEFHSAFFEFRTNTRDLKERQRLIMRLRRSVQDHAALLDQVTGSSTLVVNLPGAAEPNTPPEPEYIKAYAYFPGELLREVIAEDDSQRLDDVIQIIIRELGVPTMKRFERAIKKRFEHLIPRRQSTYKPSPLPEVEGMPIPIPDGSSRYLFYGRQSLCGALSSIRDIERHMRQQSTVDDKAILGFIDASPSIWHMSDVEADEASSGSSKTMGSISSTGADVEYPHELEIMARM